MRIPVVLFATLALLSSPIVHAGQSPDTALNVGLEMCVTNGVESGIRAWYADRPELGVEMTNKVQAAVAKLGSLVDTELVAVQPVSKRVKRYYVAIYFDRSPLWVRIDRYESRDKSFFLPLKCSTNPDEILPGYITEFMVDRPAVMR